jgi:hypothetical protein
VIAAARPSRAFPPVTKTACGQTASWHPASSDLRLSPAARRNSHAVECMRRSGPIDSRCADRSAGRCRGIGKATLAACDLTEGKLAAPYSQERRMMRSRVGAGSANGGSGSRNQWEFGGADSLLRRSAKSGEGPRMEGKGGRSAGMNATLTKNAAAASPAAKTSAAVYPVASAALPWT